MSSSPIRFQSGINPEPDDTNQNTVQCIDGNNIRFWRKAIQTIGGSALLQLSNVLDGMPRLVFCFARGSERWIIVGTHSRLYAVKGHQVYNITPLKTTGTALGTNPISTSDGDDVINITFTAHGLTEYDRIRIAGATTVGGISDVDLNIETIVVGVNDANTIQVTAGSVASGSVSGGGSGITIYKQIDDGNQNASSSTGKGIGLKGEGLKGDNQTDDSLLAQPRIYAADTFGDTFVFTPGAGGKAYAWLGDPDVAPAIISGAPDCDWLFVDDAKLCILSGNTTANSNVGDYTDWTPGAASSAFSDDREDAVKLISEANVNGEHLIFADENKIFREVYVGGALKWRWNKLSDNIGIIGPMGRVVVNGVCYIFGKDNLYRYNGGIIEPLPRNTLRNFLFGNLNRTQQYKCFAWYCAAYDEVHFHAPLFNSLECSHAIVYSISEGHFSKREIDRTAAEQAGQIFNYPLLASSDGKLHQHEIGVDNSGVAQEVYVQLAYRTNGNAESYTDINGIEPDAVITGTVTFDLYGKDRAQDTGMLLGSYPVTDTTSRVDLLKSTRWWSWKMRQEELGGSFRTGRMFEFLERGSEI